MFLTNQSPCRVCLPCSEYNYNMLKNTTRAFSVIATQAFSSPASFLEERGVVNMCHSLLKHHCQESTCFTTVFEESKQCIATSHSNYNALSKAKCSLLLRRTRTILIKKKKSCCIRKSYLFSLLDSMTIVWLGLKPIAVWAIPIESFLNWGGKCCTLTLAPCKTPSKAQKLDK